MLFWLFLALTTMPVISDYVSILRRLYHRNQLHPVKMGLTSINALYEVLGRPLDNIPVVHVTGTNGKGSVCFKTAAVLRKSGLRTGLFVSPHISSYRERVVVDGEMLTEDDVVKMLTHLMDVCDKGHIPATVFELNTALACLKFRESQCDAAVLEVGLGGRLDATNIISPSLSVITTVQLDHTRILGDTIEQIAIEKAGIIKPGVPVLVGPELPIDIIRDAAFAKNAPLHTLKEVIGSNNERGWKNPDILNTDIARAVTLLLENLPGDIKGASKLRSSLNNLRTIRQNDLEDALLSRSPCRFDIVPTRTDAGNVDVILDIAHNVDAITALMEQIRSRVEKIDGKVIIVIGLSTDKQVTKILKAVLQLRDILDSVYCVAANHPRACSQEFLSDEFAKELSSLSSSSIAAESGIERKVNIVAIQNGDVSHGVETALAAAQSLKQRGQETSVLICGSCFIMGQARQAIGIDVPCDDDSLNTILRSHGELDSSGVAV